MQRRSVKNANEKFPPNALIFVSESGYAYTIDEIADFISGGATYQKHKQNYEMQGTFRDFKNKEKKPDPIRDNSQFAKVREDLPMNMFSKHDIEILLRHPQIEAAFKKHAKTEADFINLQAIGYIMQENGVLSAMQKTAEASQVLNGQEGGVEQHVSQVLSAPLHQLGVKLKNLKSTEKKMLEDLTSRDGYIGSYAEGSARGRNLLEDVEALQHYDCGANFCIHINNVANVLSSYDSYYRYAEKLEKEADNSPHEKIFNQVKFLKLIYTEAGRDKHAQEFEALINRLQDQTTKGSDAEMLTNMVRILEEEFQKYLNNYTKGFMGIGKKSPSTYGDFLSGRTNDYHYPYLLGGLLKQLYAENKGIKPNPLIAAAVENIKLTRYGDEKMLAFKTSMNKNTMKMEK